MAKSVISFILLVFVLSGCATDIKAPASTNPPPTEALSNFGQFVLNPVELNAEGARSSDNERASAKINEYLYQKLSPLLATWSSDQGRKLQITPKIEELKFVSGGVRFMAGAMAGSSAVVMRVEFRDLKTNTLIADPVFYQHANAWTGGWSVGGSDNAMLERIAAVVETYLVSNYGQAVGGPTGAPPDRVASNQAS